MLPFSGRLYPNYYDDLRSNSAILLNVESDTACEHYCSMNENCILYAFVSKDDPFDELPYGACILKSKIDVSNGTLCGTAINIYSVKSK